ncbi:MAG: hypothetical protein JNM70_18350 [Anaerolineae bacterium]|nr:hypothetical protein [Anaerolineae bacterium]
MWRKPRFWLVMVAVALMPLAGSALAGDNDDDGDGIPNGDDCCPTVAGTPANFGCPDNVDPDTGKPVADDKGGEGAHDSDSDGVFDFVDFCPDQAGTGFNNGCPDGVPPTNSGNVSQPVVPVVWESTDVCLVAVPNGGKSANVREDDSTSAARMGQLKGGAQWSPEFMKIDANGMIWYAGPDGGWVADVAVIDNGLCDDVSLVEDDAVSGV